MTLGESVVGQVGLTHEAKQIGLEARAFAANGVDWLQVEELFCVDEASPFAQRPVKSEAR